MGHNQAGTGHEPARTSPTTRAIVWSSTVGLTVALHTL
jgi:hypothetical protein